MTRNVNFSLTNASIGPSFSNSQVEEILRKNNIFELENLLVKKYSNFDDINSLLVKEICDGNVIGWFQGGMEWGPRALGNRSIISDPRRLDMKEILNLKISVDHLHLIYERSLNYLKLMMMYPICHRFSKLKEKKEI